MTNEVLGLAVWAWLLIALILIIAIVVIIVIAVTASKKNKAKAATEKTESEKSEKPAEKKAEPAKAEKPAANKSEPVEDEEEDSASVRNDKVYHISKRKTDGRWQVKAAHGAKAVKLFLTQNEAIEYAKTLADNQEARIMIHKEDGSFRKLTYKK